MEKSKEHQPVKETPIKWSIYAEKSISIKPKDGHRIAVGLGYEMS